MREKPKSVGEPRNGPGRAFNGYKDYGTPSLAFWLIPPIFPNEIFGDLLYKLSSVTTVNRYITRNATGPDSLALKRSLLFLGMRQKNPLTMSPLKKKCTASGARRWLRGLEHRLCVQEPWVQSLITGIAVLGVGPGLLSCPTPTKAKENTSSP